MADQNELAIQKRIGQTLQAYRRAKGLNLNAMAKLVGVSPQQLWKYETGQDRISAARLCRMADALCVPVAAMFEDVETQTEDVEGVEMMDSSRSAMSLLRSWRRIQSPFLRRAILGFVRSIADGQRDGGQMAAE